MGKLIADNLNEFWQSFKSTYKTLKLEGFANRYSLVKMIFYNNGDIKPTALSCNFNNLFRCVH